MKQRMHAIKPAPAQSTRSTSVLATKTTTASARIMLGGGRATPDGVLALQRLAGNKAVEHAISAAREVVGHGSCDAGGDFECTAAATRTPSKSMTVSTTPKKQKDGTYIHKGSGTLTSTFKTSVSISLAQAPSGLSKCATDKFNALIKNKLNPHEQDHKRRFTTTDPKHAYNGTFTKTLKETGDDPSSVESSIKGKLESEHDTEVSKRETRNDKHAIDAIDPFKVSVDISDCPECKPAEEE